VSPLGTVPTLGDYDDGEIDGMMISTAIPPPSICLYCMMLNQLSTGKNLLYQLKSLYSLVLHADILFTR
jgi:hypothetical protein